MQTAGRQEGGRVILICEEDQSRRAGGSIARCAMRRSPRRDLPTARRGLARPRKDKAAIFECKCTGTIIITVTCVRARVHVCVRVREARVWLAAREKTKFAARNRAHAECAKSKRNAFQAAAAAAAAAAAGDYVLLRGPQGRPRESQSDARSFRAFAEFLFGESLNSFALERESRKVE